MEIFSKVVHLPPALLAVLLGIYMLLSKKGSRAHIVTGRVWVAVMLLVAGSGLFLTGGPLAVYKGYGYTHALSVFVLIALPIAIWAVRDDKRKLHSTLMLTSFGGLIFAGLIALALRTNIF